MALSKRLFSIFSMVEKGSVAADIGCDHGLLSIALIKEHICKHVYACDLRKGPLNRAQEAITFLGLENDITTVLCDGIDGVGSDCDTIIIAGMGFDTIKGILERHEHLSRYKRIIIQCNKHVNDVRRWISEHHYTIEQEDLVEEDHFYEILAFSCKEHEPYNEDEILFGITLNTHPLFEAYWKHRLEKIALVLKHMPKNHINYASQKQLYDRIYKKLKEGHESTFSISSTN